MFCLQMVFMDGFIWGKKLKISSNELCLRGHMVAEVVSVFFSTFHKHAGLGEL